MCVSIKNPEIQNPQVKDKGTDSWLFKCKDNIWKRNLRLLYASLALLFKDMTKSSGGDEVIKRNHIMCRNTH